MNDRHTKMLLVLQSILCLFLLQIFTKAVFPFTTDSLMHISTAQRILSLKGLTFSNFYILPPIPDFIPAILAPPGYPILIVLLKLIGINEYTASLLIPRMSFMLLPFLFFIVFRKLAPDPVAMVATFICTFMLPVVKCALIAWTDVPYLLISLMSLAAAFKIIEKKGKLHWSFVFFAGILAGYAFLLRYVGVTLIAGLAAGLIASALLRMIQGKELIKTACSYCSGVLLVVVPYLLRNFIVFSAIKSSVPPMPVPLSYTLHAYFQVLAEMIFINRSFEIIIVMLILGLLLGFVMSARTMFANNRERLIYFFMLIVYFLANSVLMIALKTNYLYCEGIDDRFLIQMAWILIGGLIIGGYSLFKSADKLQPISRRIITAFVLALFFLFQVFPARAYFDDQKRIVDLSHKIQHYVPLLRSLPKDYVIVTNVADITYYLATRNVRWISNYTPSGLLYYLGSKRRFAVFIVREAPNLWVHGPDWLVPKGYYRGYADKNVDLFLPLADFRVQ